MSPLTKPMHSRGNSDATMADHGAAAAHRVKDPVCGMMVDPSTTAHKAEHAGQGVFFCSSGCRIKFLAEPERYLDPHPVAPPAPTGAIFTCPMHPEIEQVGPGSCPICGMALEPKQISAESGPNHELIDMQRRLWVGALFGAPVVLIAMGGHLLPPRAMLSAQAASGIQLVLSTLVVFWAGATFFMRGWQSLKSRKLNMFTLIAIGTGVAWGYSVIATLMPWAFPDAFRMQDGAVGVYFEASATIIVLVLVGQVLELRARDQTGSAIRGLLNLVPKTGRRIGADGVEQDVPLERIVVGDRLRLRPGEQVPVDGIVIDGVSSLDEAMVTGESLPVTKGLGDTVVGGTINRSGSIVIEARKVGADTLLSRVVQSVADAQRSRAPIQRLADRISGSFVPAVLVAAALAFVAWLAVGPEPRLAYAIIAAVSVLIIACPCALGLATPMSIMVGMGRGAQAGILIRDAEVLEILEKVDTLVIDKTGTLTEGHPAVVGTVTATGFEADEVLRLAAAVEQYSEHPLARAIMRRAEDRAIRVPAVAGFEAPAGQGAKGTVDGRVVLIGTQAFLEASGADCGDLPTAADRWRGEGATTVFVAADGRAAGMIAIADPIKAAARSLIETLQKQGFRIVMLTGDHRRTAEAVAKTLGLTEIEAEILPHRKAEIVEALKAKGRVVAMAGDGVNDAPALASADVGIAMGTGADIAKQSAGVTLLGGDLHGLLRARRLSEATMSNIRQNLAFAFAYNLIGVPVAAGLLYPVFGLLLSPEIAAAAMALSSVSVIGNALRLRSLRLG